MAIVLLKWRRIRDRLAAVAVMFGGFSVVQGCGAEPSADVSAQLPSLTEVVEGSVIVRSRQLDPNGYVESEIVDEKVSRQLALAWADPVRRAYEYATPLDETGTGRVHSVPLPAAKGLADYNAMLVARYRARVSLPVEPYADPVAHARGCGPTSYDSCVQGHCNQECCSRRQLCRFKSHCDEAVSDPYQCLACEQDMATCFSACSAQAAIEPDDAECGEERECTLAERVALDTMPAIVDLTLARIKGAAGNLVGLGAFGPDPVSGLGMMDLLECPGPEFSKRYCSLHKCFDQECAERLLAADVPREQAIKRATWCASDCQIQEPRTADCACPSGQEWCHDGDTETCRDENGNNARCVPTGTCGPELLSACDCEASGRIRCVQTDGCAAGTKASCVGDQDRNGDVDSRDCDEWRETSCACGAKGQPCCGEANTCNTGLGCAADGKCTDACGRSGEACCALSANKCVGNSLDCIGGKCEPCGTWGRACCDTDRRSACDSGFACEPNDGRMECLPNPCGEQAGQWCCIGEEYQCRPGHLQCGFHTCEPCGGINQPCCWQGGSDCREGACSDADICVRPKACSSTIKAGGNAKDTQIIDLGKTSGHLRLEFNTYIVPDRIQVAYEGNVLIDTNCSATATNGFCPFDPNDEGRICAIHVPFSGSSSQATVVVTPRCNNDLSSDTAWKYLLLCP